MNSKIHKCKENDNIIKVIYSDGEIDEVWFKSPDDSGYIVFGYNDIKQALEI